MARNARDAARETRRSSIANAHRNAQKTQIEKTRIKQGLFTRLYQQKIFGRYMHRQKNRRDAMRSLSIFDL